jgi:hypothetical protein
MKSMDDGPSPVTDTCRGAWASLHLSVMDRDQRAGLRKSGEGLRVERQDRDDLRGRSPEQVRELREQAAQSAAVCADCFTPLAATASATMVERRVLIPAKVDGPTRFPQVLAALGGPRKPDHPASYYERWLRVPICLLCWLRMIGDSWLLHPRDYERLRCDGCVRPMRVKPRCWDGPYLSERICCRDCARAATNARARKRRRVQHEQAVCIVCHQTFTPRREDAFMCSNRCRQRAHRMRHAPARPD